MSTPSIPPLVDCRTVTVHQAFEGRSYDIDYFQRDYVWGREQVQKFVSDLCTKFSEQWRPTHARSDVSTYSPYFLGSFITYHDGNDEYLADGQQRFITLQLYLIHLYRLLQSSAQDESQSITALILRSRLGRRRCAVHSDEYQQAFSAMLNGRSYNTDGQPPRVQRLVDAYHCIIESHPQEMTDEGLPYFVDWLRERVSLVEIEAHDRGRASEIFRTVNDRGMQLAPMDHLKESLLTDGDPMERSDLNTRWHDMVSALEAIGTGTASRYLQALLRGRYAEPTALSRESGGSDEFASMHEWVEDNRALIWPDGVRRGQRAAWFTDVIEPFSEPYKSMLRARSAYDSRYASVYFNEHNRLDRQFDLTLGALKPGDGPIEQEHKIQLVANTLDYLYVTAAVDNRDSSQSALDLRVAEVLLAVRRARRAADIAPVLAGLLPPASEAFRGILELRLTGDDHLVRYLLARLTAWVESEIVGGVDVNRYLERRRDAHGFEIEHLLPKNDSAYQESLRPEEYRRLRSRIGALVLLDGRENSSLGGLPLVDKIQHYIPQNRLAASLSPAAYTQRATVNFRRFRERHGLTNHFTPFDPGVDIRAFVTERTDLYREIAIRVWDPARMGLAFTAPPQPEQATVPPVPRSRGRLTPLDLVDAGLLARGATLYGVRRNSQYKAHITQDGRIRTETGSAFDSPSGAAADVLDRRGQNGWTFWRLEATDETLDALRMRHFARHPR